MAMRAIYRPGPEAMGLDYIIGEGGKVLASVRHEGISYTLACSSCRKRIGGGYALVRQMEGDTRRHYAKAHKGGEE